VQGPRPRPVFSPQSETNDNDPASKVFQDLLPPDQNEKQVAGQPAAFDPNFMSKINNFLATISEPTADVSECPSIAEEDFLEAFLPNCVSSSQPSLENIPREVSSHGVAQEEASTGVSNVEEEQMDIETTWDLDVPSSQPETPPSNIYGLLDDYIVPSPKPETFSNTLLTAVTPPFSLLVNTNVDPTPVVQAPPIPTGPSKSQRSSVIMQGPALANKLLTIQSQHGKHMNTSVGNTVGDIPFVIQVTPIPVQISPVPSASSATRGKKVPKTNAERCKVYRGRQKTKKEKDEEELRQLDAKNRALKAKEAALRNKIRTIKDAARRMGLRNYFN